MPDPPPRIYRSPPRRRTGSRGPLIALVIILVVVIAVVALRGAHPSQPASARPLAVLTSATASAVHATPTTSIVATEPQFYFGESVGGASHGSQFAAATTWDPGIQQAVVRVWSRAQGHGWQLAHSVLPVGFHRSYDATIATTSNGTVVVGAGIDLNKRLYCIDGGSVAITRFVGTDAVNTTVIDDRRGTHTFDDRPTVAAGVGSDVWAGWSRGIAAHACDTVGGTDQIQIAFSHDNGNTFSAPLTVASRGANFGVQIAPVGPADAYLTWAQILPGNTFNVLVAEIRNGKLVAAPQDVGTGVPHPTSLNGASFPVFTSPSILLVNHRPGVAWPTYSGGVSQITVALPNAARTGWNTTNITPSPGNDNLLPAIGLLPNGTVLLTYAIRVAATDAIGYESRVIGTTADGTGITASLPTQISAPIPGPGFHELGELSQISPTGSMLSTAFSLGGATRSQLLFATWGP